MEATYNFCLSVAWADTIAEQLVAGRNKPWDCRNMNIGVGDGLGVRRPAKNRATGRTMLWLLKPVRTNEWKGASAVMASSCITCMRKASLAYNHVHKRAGGGWKVKAR